MEDQWCIVHGLPGRDPLSIEGGFADEATAAKKAALHAQARPDVPAIVDKLIHPDNIEINFVGGFPVNVLSGDLKHISYGQASPHHSARIRELIQNVEHRLASLEKHLDDQGISINSINVDDQNRLWAETREKTQTTGPLEEELRGHVQQLLLVNERLGRAMSAARTLTRGAQ